MVELGRTTSNNVKRTPLRFIQALAKKFDRIDFDLAADESNTVTRYFYDYESAEFRNSYFTIEDDSLSKDWSKLDDLLYLNPPFDRIKPWVQKAAGHRLTLRDEMLILIPASVGSNWWERYVDGKCFEWRLKGRIPFDPTQPTWGFPKDLALLQYGPRVAPGHAYWDWRK